MTRLTRTLALANLWLGAAGLVAPLFAAEVQIAAVQFPENKSLDVPLAATTRVAS